MLTYNTGDILTLCTNLISVMFLESVGDVFTVVYRMLLVYDSFYFYGINGQMHSV